MKYFKLPDLGEGLPEAEILEWHIAEGDTVKTDQIIVSVETAKAVIEIPSPQDGVISHLFGSAGDTIHTGEPLLEFQGEEDSDSGTVVGEIPRAENQTAAQDNFIVGSATPSISTRTQATPAVRALAKRLNIDLELVQGSGNNGHITPADIEKAARIEQQHGKAEPLKGVRKHMAKTMIRAHEEIVPVTIHETVDIDGWNDGEDITIRLIQAIATACQAEPACNAWFDGSSLSRRIHKHVDLGVAVDTDQGLFVPVLRNITERSQDDLRNGLNRLRADVKERTIPPSELTGATITLSNFGVIAGQFATPVVVPPQVMIIGSGRVSKQPMVVDDKIQPRKVIPLSITFDHRSLTGGEAARFVQQLITSLHQTKA